MITFKIILITVFLRQFVQIKGMTLKGACFSVSNYECVIATLSTFFLLHTVRSHCVRNANLITECLHSDGIWGSHSECLLE